MHGIDALQEVPFDSEGWAWEGGVPTPTEHLGRECVWLDSGQGLLDGIELADGVIEVEFATGPERGFHGVVWRARESFESFFVRPHQVGNPDSIQYTPAFNGISSWQLYHGPGYWNPITFPIDEWFRVRVVFAGDRGEAYVGAMGEPALVIGELKLPVEHGRIGVFSSGAYVAGFAYDASGSVALRAPAPPPPAPVDGIVPAWSVSDAFREDEVAGPALDRAHVDARAWSTLASEPTGLADLARINGIHDGRNCVYARAPIRSDRPQTKLLDFGFSDRAIVYLNGEPLYRGDDTYRTRDYRFLGSIGYYDSVYLQLEEGENDLVIAVSEDFGGWGVQARFADLRDISL